MVTASQTLLAMPASQLVLMLLSFAGMFGFAGVALWLFVRQRRAQPPAAVKPAPLQARAPREPEPKPEPTEFIALAGQREDDSPQPHPHPVASPAGEVDEGTAFVEPPPGIAERTSFVAPPSDPEPDGRTSFVAPFTDPEPDERTSFIAAPLPSRPRVVAPRSDPEPDERTSFIAAPLESAPVFASDPKPVERTSFVAPPSDPEPDERTSFIAAPLPSAPGERTSFVAPSDPAPGERTGFVAPPSDAAERTGFIARPIPPAERTPIPPSERTGFIAPPIAPAERTGFVAPIQPPAPPPIEARPIPPISTAPRPPTAESESEATARLRVELREHFDLAVADLTQLEQHDDDNIGTALHGHLEVLASAPAELLLELLRPAIEAPDPAGTRCNAAWLALLQHKTWQARRALPELLATLDQPGRAAGLLALASWDDPRAESLAAAGLDQATIEHRREWLELFAERGWDPGERALDEALSSSDPDLLIVALRIAAARAPERVRAQVSAQLFAATPAVRIEAIETALVFAEQSAWLICRQLARNPAFARAAELVGLLGSADEVTALGQSASVGNSPALLWGLGLSGRADALQVCAEALDDDELRAPARAALAIACGCELDSAADARAWLANAPAGARLIGGVPRTLDAIARALAASDSLPLRRAIARELKVRSGGRVALAAELRPRAFRRQLDALRRLVLDLDREFPWHD